ncbi:hypothetical protein [Streptomyces sp. NPDC088261]|uniref:hypothetical protein n=1 Tax=Streptomyces sp. NPDC088261 TaxID=3365851 RepID=UPI0038010EB0
MTTPALYEIETSEGDDGTMHPGDQQTIAEFTAMLSALKKAAPWTGQGDIAVRIGEYGLERGRPLPEQQPDADPVALALIHPDTGTALTATLHCAQSRIHGAWTTPYRLLTHALAGRDLPADIDLST